MADKLLLTFSEDGKATLYDSTYDITIHCESEEDREKAIERINNSIPCAFINSLITDPSNVGTKSCVLSWLKRKWEEEQNDSD